MHFLFKEVVKRGAELAFLCAEMLKCCPEVAFLSKERIILCAELAFFGAEMPKCCAEMAFLRKAKALFGQEMEERGAEVVILIKKTRFVNFECTNPSKNDCFLCSFFLIKKNQKIKAV
jgi:hypothetical protein